MAFSEQLSASVHLGLKIGELRYRVTFKNLSQFEISNGTTSNIHKVASSSDEQVSLLNAIRKSDPDRVPVFFVRLFQAWIEYAPRRAILKIHQAWNDSIGNFVVKRQKKSKPEKRTRLRFQSAKGLAPTWDFRDWSDFNKGPGKPFRRKDKSQKSLPADKIWPKKVENAKMGSDTISERSRREKSLMATCDQKLQFEYES